jgi:hypothetical protein
LGLSCPCCPGQNLQCNGATCCSGPGGFCGSTPDCCAGSGLQCVGSTCSLVSDSGGPEAGEPDGGVSPDGGACLQQDAGCVRITGEPCCAPYNCMPFVQDGGSVSFCQ